MKASDLFDFPKELPFSKYFASESAPWQWVHGIEKALEGFVFSGGKSTSEIPHGFKIGQNVYLHPSVHLPPNGCIVGPAYIGENCEIRQGVLIRKNVIAAKNCILGNSCEYKNSLLLENVQTPHFNYIGDSILGNHVHLGAGVVLANLRFDQCEIQVHTENGKVRSGRRKLGGLLGDGSEIGCNATLMPGTILERKAKVGPSIPFGGKLDSEKYYLG